MKKLWLCAAFLLALTGCNRQQDTPPVNDIPGQMTEMLSEWELPDGGLTDDYLLYRVQLSGETEPVLLYGRFEVSGTGFFVVDTAYEAGDLGALELMELESERMLLVVEAEHSGFYYSDVFAFEEETVCTLRFTNPEGLEGLYSVYFIPS